MAKPIGRPPKVIRPVELKLRLPEDLKARLELLLYSEVEGRVPLGAWQKYFIALIEADLRARSGTTHG